MRKAMLHQPGMSVRQGVPDVVSWYRNPVLVRRIVMITSATVVVVFGIRWTFDKYPSSKLKKQQSDSKVIESHLAVDSRNSIAGVGIEALTKENRAESTAPLSQDLRELEAFKAAMADTTLPKITKDVRGEKEVEDFLRWRRWVEERRYPAARYELKRYLKSHPEDVDALKLLANCERRCGRWRAAVRVYRKVAALTTDSKSRQAEFMAASIAQTNGDSVTAARIFKKYLREGGDDVPMRAEALVRLTYAYKNVGLNEESRELWRRLVKNHSSAPLSQEARQMLTELSVQEPLADQYQE